MGNTFHMARLDFYTLKSQGAAYFSTPIIVIVISLIDSSLSVLGFTAAWMVLLINTNLFAIQEKYGLERLYGSLPLNRKSVVLGRYLSTTMNYLVTFFVVMIIGVLMSVIRRYASPMGGFMEGFCFSMLIYALISGIQLPIYFGVGYTKGRILSWVPFVILIGLALLQSLFEGFGRVTQSILALGNALYVISVMGSVAVMVLSYYVAVICYGRKQ